MMDTILFEKLRELQHILRRSEIFKIPNSVSAFNRLSNMHKTFFRFKEESQVVGKLKEVHLKLRCAGKITCAIFMKFPDLMFFDTRKVQS